MCAFRFQEDAERFLRVWPKRRGQCHLPVAAEQTQLRRCSRVHPRTTRRVTLLGVACFWMPDRHGVPRVTRRTARQQLHAACQRRTEWSKQHRPLPGRACFQRLQARLRGHYNSSGVRGNSRSRNRCFHWAMDWTFQWLTRRGGQQSRDTWEQCTHVLHRVTRARPRITEVPRRSVFACRLCCAPRQRVQPQNRMRENCPSGTVRAATRSRTSSCYDFSPKDIT